MSRANWAVTYSVSRVSRARRVRMYAEQLPSGRSASLSTARWVRPRIPLRASTRTAAVSRTRWRVEKVIVAVLTPSPDPS